MHPAITIIGKAIRSVLPVAALAWSSMALARAPIPLAIAGRPAILVLVADTPRAADFLAQPASDDARRIADWVVATNDHRSQPFVIIDKIRAKVFVFDAAGRLRGASLALLGMARGDDTAPGIGTRKLSEIRPEDRTTPAGRFVATLGRDLHQDILWIDYENAISLHRVIRGLSGDHRLERLATPSPLDKRISFGCVNVPVKFYEDVVLPTFTGTAGIVYILPETRALQDVFPLARVGQGTPPDGAKTGR